MPASEILVGRRLANFHILKLLGRGGMAEVYYGWDVKLDRPVAIKVIDTRSRNDPLYAQRFVHEARAIAAWHHPNIIPIYYADDEAGYIYYVMEYIQGMDLEQILNEYSDRNELIPHADVIRIGRAAADAIDYAHRHGVIHRDVKPSNLLISTDSRVVLTDFGLAFSIQKGSIGAVFGSPHYIAPEQARDSSQVVPQSDLYALAVILYQMLTGALPFDDPSPTALALQHLTLDPPRPRQINSGLSQEVEDVLLRGLSKGPDDRYRSGKELMDALAAALNVIIPTSPYLPQKNSAVETAQTASPRLSQISLAQIVDERREATALFSPGAVSEPIRKMVPGVPTQLTRFWIGCGVLILLGAMGFFLAALLLNPDRPCAQAVAPVLTFEVDTARSATVQPTQTIPPIQTVEIVAVIPTRVQPATEIPAASTIAEPTEIPPSPTLNSPPDAPPPGRPDGDLFVMYYDKTGFYIKNLSGKDRSVYPLAFELLGKDDNPVVRMEGWYWGNIYSKFRADYCMVLEILELTEHLSPKECNDLYLVYRRPIQNSGVIFWIKDKDAKEFRVLWAGEEVGRCKIDEKYCEVYLP